MKKKKVIIFLKNLKHYRVPILNIVADQYDLTIAVENPEGFTGYKFKTVYAETKISKGFHLLKPNIYKLIEGFDIVICLFNLRCMDQITLPLFTRKKVIFWGIGVSASYNKGFDADKKLDFLRKFVVAQSDAMIFYSNFPILKYKPKYHSKFFVANNTINVHKRAEPSSPEKKYILFVGSLYPEKGIDVLLNHYLSAYTKNNRIKKLAIVGSGEMQSYIENFIKENKLEEKIILLGPIYNQVDLQKIYNQSIISVSPNQAGLSVLNSFGYGVPFVTHKNAITGGEIFNIKDNVNGILMDSFDQLYEIFIDCSIDESKYIQMGMNAKNFYESNRRPEQMANEIIKALDYVSK